MNSLKSFFQNRCVLLILRWAVAGIFIYAGFQKIIAPQNFADSIASFQLLPKEIISLTALGLPPLEILLGLAVLTGLHRRPALLGLSALTVVFIMALASSIVRGIPVDCGCFGSKEPSVAQAWYALLRDIPLLAAALWLYWIAHRQTPEKALAPARDETDIPS